MVIDQNIRDQEVSGTVISLNHSIWISFFKSSKHPANHLIAVLLLDKFIIILQERFFHVLVLTHRLGIISLVGVPFVKSSVDKPEGQNRNS
jgi:hypothetical protein